MTTENITDATCEKCRNDIDGQFKGVRDDVGEVKKDVKENSGKINTMEKALIELTNIAKSLQKRDLTFKVLIISLAVMVGLYGVLVLGIGKVWQLISLAEKMIK